MQIEKDLKLVPRLRMHEFVPAVPTCRQNSVFYLSTGTTFNFFCVFLLDRKTAIYVFFPLQSRGKGTKHKKKYKRSTGGSLSDSSGSVIRQVGALIDTPTILSSYFWTTMHILLPSCRFHSLFIPCCLIRGGQLKVCS